MGNVGYVICITVCTVRAKLLAKAKSNRAGGDGGGVHTRSVLRPDRGKVPDFDDAVLSNGEQSFPRLVQIHRHDAVLGVVERRQRWPPVGGKKQVKNTVL